MGSSGEDPASADSTSNKNSDSNSNNGDNLKDLNSVTIKSSQSVNELICLDESTSSISQTDFGGITLDNFTLDGLNDDDFNPRAVDSQQKQQQQTPSTLVQVLTANEPTTPTSLLVPPPALPPREFKKISPVPENNNNPFSDTFSANSGLDDPFGMTSFSSAPAIAKPAVNSNPLASLDDLDPFKNL